ncbi:MAG: M15 family metallopeptidase [Erysipelotrichaceae bacterium]|nr:M15 family metallopeptidase [Erysipelotrichaceae bacterium]
MKKTKRALNRQVPIIVAVIGLVMVITFKVPSFIQHQNLVALGYSETAITAIKKHKIGSYITKNKIFSKLLNDEVVKEGFNKNYIDLYGVTTNVSEQSFKIYEALINKGYKKDAALKLFKALKNYNITPLLTFDLQDDNGIDKYIKDCLKHSTNNETKFQIEGSYIKYFNNITNNEFKTNMLINQNNGIDKNVKINLVDMDVNYATEGIKMEKEAYQHFVDLCDALNTNHLSIYAIEAYRSFNTQKEIYDSYSKPDEQGVSRPGHSEHNTGLAVQVISSEGTSFKTTKEYQWISENAHKYGFIIRYPEGKEKITGKDAESNLLRYVGIKEATQAYNEKMCYEEYYATYIKFANKKN